jgi:hypothetical protein
MNGSVNFCVPSNKDGLGQQVGQDLSANGGTSTPGPTEAGHDNNGSAIVPCPTNGLLGEKAAKDPSLNRQAEKAANRSGSAVKGRLTDRKKTEENPLENAWQEDFDVGQIVALVVDVFGDSIVPYLERGTGQADWV